MNDECDTRKLVSNAPSKDPIGKLVDSIDKLVTVVEKLANLLEAQERAKGEEEEIKRIKASPNYGKPVKR